MTVIDSYLPNDKVRRARWEAMMAMRERPAAPQIDRDAIPFTRCATITSSHLERDRHGVTRVETIRRNH